MNALELVSIRRIAVVINYSLLLLSLFFSMIGHSFEWPIAIKVAFWFSAIFVLVTFFPIHIQTGLWRLAHAKIGALDEREVQHTLETLRLAYIIFSIVSLLIIITSVVFSLGSQTQQLVIFWVLLYLAHTLPSSILAWTVTHVPTQIEEY
jgi:hypothetical protein